MKDSFIFDICCSIILSIYSLSSIKTPPWICLVVNQAVAQVAFLWVLLKRFMMLKVECPNVQMGSMFIKFVKFIKLKKLKCSNVQMKLCSWCCSGRFPSSPSSLWRAGSFFCIEIFINFLKRAHMMQTLHILSNITWVSFQKHYHKSLFSNNSGAQVLFGQFQWFDSV